MADLSPKVSSTGPPELTGAPLKQHGGAVASCCSKWFALSMMIPAFLLALVGIVLILTQALLATAWQMLYLGLLIGMMFLPVASAQDSPRMRLYLIVTMGIWSILFFAWFIAGAVLSSKGWQAYQADAGLGAVVSLIAMAVSLSTAGVLWCGCGRSTAPRKVSVKLPQAGRQCAFCCSCAGLPILMLLVALGTWHACSKAAYLNMPPPGVLVKTASGLSVHLYCEGGEGGYVNQSMPTVLFLHGHLGSSLDWTWLKRKSELQHSGSQLCSIDRPGYGWSEPLADPNKNFGQASDTHQPRTPHELRTLTPLLHPSHT